MTAIFILLLKNCKAYDWQIVTKLIIYEFGWMHCAADRGEDKGSSRKRGDTLFKRSS